MAMPDSQPFALLSASRNYISMFIIFNCAGFFAIVTCAFLPQENVNALSKLYTFKPIKTKFQIEMSWVSL